MFRDGSTAITGRQQLAQGSWVHRVDAGTGTPGYWKICEINITGLYCDQPIEITYTQRGQRQTCHLYIRFMPVGTSTPVVESLTYRGTTSGAYSVTNGSTTSIYVKKYEGYDQLGILEFLKDSYNAFTVTWKNEFVSSLPSGYKTATQVFSPGTANTAQVLTGYTFSSANGVNLSGSMVNRGALNWSGSNTTYSVPAGYYSGGTLDSRTSYNNGYNSGVNAGKTTGWSLKTITATGSSSDVSFTVYMPGNMSGTRTEEGPYLQFNTGVRKVCAIRAYIAFNSDRRLTIRWDAGMSSRSVTIRGSASSGAGYEQGPIGTSSSSTFWVNGTNARLPISHVDEPYYRSASFTVQIWYV